MGFPIQLDLEGQRVVVVGGGGVAARRVPRLIEAGASVTIVAPRLAEELGELVEEGRIEWSRRRYERGDLEGARLVFAATDDPEVQAAIVDESRERGIPVNVADRSVEGDFEVPAVAEFGELRLAIDTGGASPALSGALRRHLERTLDPAWARGAELLGELRPEAVELLGGDERRRLFRELVAGLPDALSGESVPAGEPSRELRADVPERDLREDWIARAADRASVKLEIARQLLEAASSGDD